MRERTIRRGDWLLTGGILAAALLLWALWKGHAGVGNSVVVTVDGTVVARYALSDTVDTVISAYHGTNRLIIRDGAATITDADCPDKICVRHGSISRTGDSILCLPHRLSVTVTGAEKAPDAVIQ